MSTTTTDLHKNTIFFTSLGCSKNLVDSQVMLGHLLKDRFEVVQEAQAAEVIIVNTCSFVEAAKQESIETVLDLADYKLEENGVCKALVMSGCMAQRYHQELEKELPEIDLFIGTGEYHKVVPLLNALREGTLEKKSFVEIPKYIHTEFDPRINTSPSHMSYLKISEGCDRNCTFCIIPTLRGALRSRSVESLVTEAEHLIAGGVKELNLISQDFSSYGKDIIGSKEKGIASTHILDLLKGLSSIEDANWIRIFYFYPDDLSEEIMSFIGENPKICKYLDMPIQHFSDSVLKRMNRFVTGDIIKAKLAKLREKVPGIFIRTSVIVGFPGETQEDFDTLVKGVKEGEFDHLGVFKYSDEEGTPAFRIPNKVDQEIIDERFEIIYELQKEISARKNKKLIGQKLQVIVEGAHEETELLIQGRHQGQAPDIDGKVIINDGLAYPGDIVTVEITDALEYDLVGHIIK